MGLVTKHLPMGGYWMVESGVLNRIEHLWIYQDMAERDACRAGLVQEAAWMQDFIPRAFQDVVAQSNRIMTLTRGSAALDEVIAARKSVQPNQGADTPMFADRLNALTVTDTGTTGDCLAAFRVLTGDRPGTHITLTAGDFDSLTTGTVGALSHQILRPMTLSPLR